MTEPHEAGRGPEPRPPAESVARAERLQSLGQLAVGVAHDFNNLLAIVGGCASAVLRRLDDAAGHLDPRRLEELRADLDQIADASTRAAGLTRQLLSFAAQEAAEPEPIDVNRAIEEALGLLGRTLGRHVELVTRLGGGLPRVRLDPSQLGQILVNLAVNSRDAMPEGGRLRIETGVLTPQPEPRDSGAALAPGSFVRIRVTDTGSGMEPEVARRAFDPFFTTRPGGEGSGLGLATVHRIVTAASGRVALESEVGRGTSVTVLLPAADLAGAGAGGDGGATTTLDEGLTAPPAAAGHTVLVVEDEPALGRVIARALDEAGYRVLFASGSAQALELAQREDARIDLVVSDVVLADMMGPQLAREIGRRHPGARAVFMSGLGRPALSQRGQHVDGPLLVKPFHTAELLAAVARALSG